MVLLRSTPTSFIYTLLTSHFSLRSHTIKMGSPAVDHRRLRCVFEEWIAQQQEDLEELSRAMESNLGSAELFGVVDKNVKHFEEYQEHRALLAEQNGGPPFLSPSWCTTFENAFMWIGGCRPSLSIRLVYSLCGSDLDSQLQGYLQGERTGSLADISAAQLNQINALQSKTVREEDKLSSRIATLQEDMADEPLAMIVNKSKKVGESSSDVERALDNHAVAMGRMVVEADKLRLRTLTELVKILTPVQAAHLLLVAKKLHLSIHEWSKKRDGGAAAADRQFNTTQDAAACSVSPG
ncbi:protein DOG1-like 1 [Ipomoea triloba]|uniref:protein DOG1-like 1 n=1 Tax=Ipomoea triloba TaxID=35885 RepID=UPI00125E6748|nr:protein DOG1-like 1 [Ipomoea triloba]